MIPILPTCLAYQIAYGIFIKNKNKNPIWITTVSVAALTFLIVIGLNAAKEYVAAEKIRIETAKKEEIRNNINEILNNANEIIKYNESTIHLDGIGGTEYTTSTMFIDYDRKRVAFLFSNYGNDYIELSLSENVKIDNDVVLFKKVLSYPGKTLTTYSLSESESHRIVAIELLMEDNRIYAIDGIKDDNGRLGGFFGLWYIN